MSSSWPVFVSQCKSRLSAIARSCFLGREYWHDQVEKLEQGLDEFREEGARCEECRQQLEQENHELRQQVAELEAKLAQVPRVEVPVGEVPPGQQYGAGLIALCVNLASAIGLRPAVRTLHIVFDWLGIKEQLPKYQTIRMWMQRIGLHRQQNAKKTSGGIWLTDHTNQIGREKVLIVMRVRGSKLPHPGVALRLRDVELLAVVPGEKWQREDVAKVYQEVAKRCGIPRAVESDGAVELREPVETLGKPGKKPLVIRDMKHFLANRLESLLNHDPQYQAFMKQLAGSRSALQQTELAHFIPPGSKMKARFMNLKPTLTWASTVLWHLDHPGSQSRKEVTEDRMTEKLGWLSTFAPSIRQWQACQEIISTTLTFINEQGIFRGVVEQFEKLVAGITHSVMSQELARTVVEFLRENEQKLRPNERLPMSTEIVESSFSLYKQLEQQHSKGGFTSLILVFPTLLRMTTPKEVTTAFRRVKVSALKQWVKTHLPNSLTSKRQLVFREPRLDRKNKAKNSATSPLLAA